MLYYYLPQNYASLFLLVQVNVKFRMFRIGGNIKFDDSNNQDDSKLRLHIGKNNKSLAFIQYLQPLNTLHPYFYVHILNIS